MADRTTDELISAVLEGQTDLFAEVIRRHQRSVLRIATAMLYDRGATEDIVQQVFLNAYQHLDRFDLGRDFGAWIRTIARNVVREELRRASRYDARLRVYQERIAAEWSNDNESTARDQRLDETLEVCLLQLGSRAAEVVRLRYHEGCDFKEIAESMKASQGAVRNVLCRTLARLRECLQRTAIS